MAKGKNPATRLTAAEKRVYDLLHRAWRTQAIDSFYFGRRDRDDATVVWRINNTEYPRDARGVVSVDAADMLTIAGVTSVEWAETWCGYKGITVMYADGDTMHERHDGHRVIRTVTRAERHLNMVVAA